MLNALNNAGRYYDLYFNDSGIDNTCDAFLTGYDTLILNKKGYEALYNKVDKLTIDNKDFNAYLSYDVSSYFYWSYDQKESNYIMLTIEIKNKKFNADKILNLIADKILYPLENYYDFLTSRKHYLRSLHK